jgi:hypothetical protein
MDTDRVAQAKAELDRQKKQAHGAVAAGPLRLVPVPSIQTELIDLMMEDETALAARFWEAVEGTEEAE